MSATQVSGRDADPRACMHEAAHAVVGAYFGQAVESVRVDGGAGNVLFEYAPNPAQTDALVRTH